MNHWWEINTHRRLEFGERWWKVYIRREYELFFADVCVEWVNCWTLLLPGIINSLWWAEEYVFCLLFSSPKRYLFIRRLLPGCVCVLLLLSSSSYSSIFCSPVKWKNFPHFFFLWRAFSSCAFFPFSLWFVVLRSLVLVFYWIGSLTRCSLSHRALANCMVDGLFYFVFVFFFGCCWEGSTDT